MMKRTIYTIEIDGNVAAKIFADVDGFTLTMATEFADMLANKYPNARVVVKQGQSPLYLGKRTGE